MRAIPTIDHLEDLQLETDVGVIVLPSGWPIGLDIGLAQAVGRDEEGVCVIAHGLKVLGDAVQGPRAAPQVIDVGLGYLDLDQHHFVAELLEAGLDRHLDTIKLPNITAYALL